MENRSIFLYLAVMRCGDGESYAGRVLVVPVQASRRAALANPRGLAEMRIRLLFGAGSCRYSASRKSH